MSTAILLGVFLGLPTAQAEWSGSQHESTSTSTSTSTNPQPITDQRSSADTISEMDSALLKWLQPRRKKMEQNPYAQTDFTAYSLEWGETKIGLANVTVGVLPRTQIGTVPALDLLGVHNANAKINFFRLGPLDMAITGHRYQLSAGQFSASQTGLGGMTSIRLASPLSVHLGGHYQVLRADGLPDFGQLSPLLYQTTGVQVSSETLQKAQEHVDLHFKARRITAEAALDLRLNRRDSIILRGNTTIWREVETGIESDIPPLLGLNNVFDQSGEVSLKDAYTASAAWQFAWKRAELRLGLGVSSVPGAWLLQSTEFSYRFGGSTRNGERRIRSAWRQQKRSLRQAGRAGLSSTDQAS